ncbi:hypothetical protein LGL08_02155 [Clostridium estertheticum]|uniref:hypothetical protein n=1 Tax=Clostridium estertheticum TaxID=238834 RepID=UPI001CF44C74|nr:hypothetical protein [Clostridium estertheticum]MCB2305275.1 hypothetical protein [Clostridium estertheticum]MCB2343455.1 hypothetical protein [Clostridium estertheticum]MCB2348375.1 hypothetical protein [Clostridium estertheticum]WAG47324.1 hypothetical protein LL127_07695 [Clostridium estertheticum]
MAVLFLIIIFLVPVLLTIVILDKYTKNKTSIQIMLIGIEVTIVGVAIIAFGGGGFSSNETFYFNIIGSTIVAMGLTSSIYGVKK